MNWLLNHRASRTFTGSESGMLVNMRFHPTLKLAKKLHIDSLASPVGVPEDLATWYANLFRVDRVQYILFTNAPSSFSVLVYGRGITTGDQLIDAFDTALRDYLTPSDFTGPIAWRLDPACCRASSAKPAIARC